VRRVMLTLLSVFVVTIGASERLPAPLSPLVAVVSAQQPAEPPATPPPAPEQAPAPSAQPQPPARHDQVDINVNQPASGAIWYRSPLWIAIGSIAVILFAVVVIMMVRGGTGGATIIHER
jgi:hypothetical protein